MENDPLGFAKNDSDIEDILNKIEELKDNYLEVFEEDEKLCHILKDKLQMGWKIFSSLKSTNAGFWDLNMNSRQQEKETDTNTNQQDKSDQ